MALALFSRGRNPTELTLLSKKCGPLGPFFIRLTFCLDIMLTSWRFNEMAQAKPIFKTRRNHVYTDV